MAKIFKFIDEDMVTQSFDKVLLKEGYEIFKQNKLHSLRMAGDEKVAGNVDEGRKIFSVDLFLDKENLYSTCDCPAGKKGLCAHMAALVWAVMSMDEEEFAPLDNELMYFEDDDEDDQVDFIFDPEFEETLLRTGKASEKTILSSFGPEKKADVSVYSYKDLLDELTISKLRELAARREVSVSGSRREPILIELEEQLADPDNIVAAVNKLSTGAHLILQVAKFYSSLAGILPIHYFYAVLNRVAEVNRLKFNSDDCLAELSDLGLATVNGERVVLPVEVFNHIPPYQEFLPSYSGNKNQLSSVIPYEVNRLAAWMLLVGQGRRLVREPLLNSDWGGWPTPKLSTKAEIEQFGRAQRKIVPRLPDFLAKETQKHLVNEMGQSREKIDYLARLLEAGQLWETTNSHKIEVHKPRTEHFLTMRPPEQAQYLFLTALNLGNWSELDLARDKNNFELMRESYWAASFQAYLESQAVARLFLVHTLAALPAGNWYSIEGLLRFIHSIKVDFNSRHLSQSMWLNRAGKKVKSEDYKDWSATYGQFYTALLSGPLNWLGFCDLAWEDQNLVAFSVTSFAQILLKRPIRIDFDEKLSTAPGLFFKPGLVVEMDLTTAEPEIIRMIPTLGVLLTQENDKGTKENKKGLRLLRYQIKPEGAARLFQSGWDAQKILELLGKAAYRRSDILPPEEIVENIQKWWERFGRLHIYENMALIEFSDNFALKELLAGTNLSQYILYVFNSRLAAVRPENLNALILHLQAKGYTPKVSEPVNGSKDNGAKHG